MKTSLLKQCLVTFFLVTFLFCSLNANRPSTYKQLCNLNKYWKQHDDYKDLLQSEEYFESDRALIKLHLSLVENHLRTNYDPNLSLEQLNKRNEGLDILKAYWQNGIFPINTKHSYTVPYFIDDFNTACAVGHIMRESGAVEIVNMVKALDNYAYIEDMKFPELGEWAKEYGFTVEELKWIQPAYGPSIVISEDVIEPNCGNTNGAVDIEILNSNYPVTDYEWRLGVDQSNPIITTNQDIANIESGFYTVKMFNPSFDPNDTWTAPVTKRIAVNDIEGPTLNSNLINQTCSNGNPDGIISLNLSGNVSDYNIKWYDYDENLIATNVDAVSGLSGVYFGGINFEPPPYNYRVEVTDANGCRTHEQFLLGLISEGPYLSSFGTEVTAATCDGGGNITLGTVYSNTAVEYFWNDGDTNANRTNLTPGTYTLTITDIYGCSIEEVFEIENQCLVGSTCMDLGGVDFGDCDFVLGVALVNDVCIDLSGCDWTVNGVDYSDYFFTDLQTCIQTCTSITCDFDGTIASLPWLQTLANDPGFSIQHFVYNGQDVFFHKFCPDPQVSDAMSTLYDCEGNPICYFGGIAGFDGEDCPGFPYNAIFQSHLTSCTLPACGTTTDILQELWVQTIIDEALQDLNGYECSCYESIDLVSFGNNGIGVFVDGFEDCNAFDFPDVLYTCDGAFVCAIGEVHDYEFCYESITVIENIWSCAGSCNYDGTAASLPWITNISPIGDEYYVNEYSYNGEPVFLTGPCTPYPDALTGLFDCQGNLICQWGGIAGHNGEDCPDFVTDGVFVKVLYGCSDNPCEVGNAITDLPWLTTLIDQYEQTSGCACLAKVDVVEYNGQTAIYFDSNCNASDASDLVYDCEGNLICTQFGLSPDFCTEPITFVNTIWTCPNFMINASLDYKVNLEGAYMNDGTMSTALYDNGLLPLNQPFAGAPYNYNEPLTRATNIPGAVDWILLELREDPAVDQGLKVPGILLSDGRIVDPVTLGYPTVEIESTKEYFVLVRHRNHLDIYSTLRKLPNTYIPYDFRNSDQHTIDQVKQMADGKFAMYAGDHNSDGSIGIGDFDFWKINPAMLNVYDNADYNLDGIVQTTDWDQWYLNRSKLGLITN